MKNIGMVMTYIIAYIIAYMMMITYIITYMMTMALELMNAKRVQKNGMILVTGVTMIKAIAGVHHLIIRISTQITGVSDLMTERMPLEGKINTIYSLY